MPTPYFEVRHLRKTFGPPEHAVAAIEDISFTLQQGQFLSILGPSGCGKSTLFNLIAGLLRPDAGDILLQGKSMLLSPGLTGYMLQKDLLLPWRSIGDNIILAQTLHGTRPSVALRAAGDDIDACGLRELLHRRPDECSGGQRQRAALVRTLQTGKSLLLLDEPFGALDAITRLHLQTLLTDIATKKHLTILFVTHDVDEALLLSDEILVMGTKPGRVLRHCPLHQVRPRTLRTLSQPEIVRVKGEILELLEQEVIPDA